MPRPGRLRRAPCSGENAAELAATDEHGPQRAPGRSGVACRRVRIEGWSRGDRWRTRPATSGLAKNPFLIEGARRIRGGALRKKKTSSLFTPRDLGAPPRPKTLTFSVSQCRLVLRTWPATPSPRAPLEATPWDS